MYKKTKIYIDKDSLETIALDSSKSDYYYKNIIQIFKKQADLYIDATEEDLVSLKEPEDLNDPNNIYLFINAWNLTWPTSANDVFETISNNESNIEKNGNVIFILNISKEKAAKIRNSFGVWILSIDEINDDVFSYSFTKVFDIEEVPGDTNNGWMNLLTEEVKFLPPSNSLVISDSNLLENNKLDKDNVYHYLGLENLKDLLSVILPMNISIPFYILVICPHPKKSYEPGKMKKIILRWIEGIKKLRDYTVIIEFFITNQTLHARGMYSNNYRILLDRGLYVFELRSSKVHVDGDSFGDIKIKTYLSSPFERGDSVLDSANANINRIKKKYAKFLRKTGDPTIIEPLKDEEYSKNRILF